MAEVFVRVSLIMHLVPLKTIGEFHVVEPRTQTVTQGPVIGQAHRLLCRIESSSRRIPTRVVPMKVPEKEAYLSISGVVHTQ